ncbi:unnamed protein product [Gongylonema pulchrum]|uniref:Protein N-terminal glutamine amidohydrolase n=1 Tax=Gongylonema pulchrum TaxID=637853 RepID=A0A183DZI0_9BILA|nr:unnamed protein product [Gongylonema pulchrum]
MGSPITRKQETVALSIICKDSPLRQLAVCQAIPVFRTHYEGRHVFAIYSRNDDKVGYFVCNKVGSAIRGADDSFEESDMDHGAVIMKTVRKQFSLVTKHKAS